MRWAVCIWRRPAAGLACDIQKSEVRPLRLSETHSGKYDSGGAARKSQPEQNTLYIEKGNRHPRWLHIWINKYGWDSFETFGGQISWRISPGCLVRSVAEVDSSINEGPIQPFPLATQCSPAARMLFLPHKLTHVPRAGHPCTPK